MSHDAPRSAVHRFAHETGDLLPRRLVNEGTEGGGRVRPIPYAQRRTRSAIRSVKACSGERRQPGCRVRRPAGRLVTRSRGDATRPSGEPPDGARQRRALPVATGFIFAVELAGPLRQCSHTFKSTQIFNRPHYR